MLEILLERVEIVGFDAQIHLTHHHLSKHLHFFRERQPFHARQKVEGLSERHHDFEISHDHLLDARMQHLDGDFTRWSIGMFRFLVVWRRDDGASHARSGGRVLSVLRIEIVGRQDVGVEHSFVDLCDGSDTHRLLAKRQEHLVEWLAKGLLNLALRIS